MKPGLLQRRQVGEILSRLERKGLRTVACKMMRMDQDLCRTHYSHLRERSFFPALEDYMTSGPMLALVLEGYNAIEALRALCGPTESETAPPGTIRGDYALLTRKNIIHSSDSPETAAEEITRFFQPEEIFSYDDEIEHWYW
ncbi:MAG: nucleoside-diphosphate kinase [Spirochaeta sp.]